MNIAPLNPGFAGDVTGIDLTGKLTAAQVAAIEAGMDRYAVLVFRDQPLTDEQQCAFSRNFGELEVTLIGQMSQPHERRGPLELGHISNLDLTGALRSRDDNRRMYSLGNRLWHSDASFRATGAGYSLLSARIVPGYGGNTEFADMRAAYDALDDEVRAMIADLVCQHTQLHSRGVLGFTDFTDEERLRFAPVPQRLVRRHPVTGRASIFLSSHAASIDGWPVPEARALLRDLTEHATQREFVHAHVWRQDDLVMWDNRVTMHRARRYPVEQARDMHRTTVACEASTMAQAA